MSLVQPRSELIQVFNRLLSGELWRIVVVVVSIPRASHHDQAFGFFLSSDAVNRQVAFGAATTVADDNGSVDLHSLIKKIHPRHSPSFLKIEFMVRVTALASALQLIHLRFWHDCCLR